MEIYVGKRLDGRYEIIEIIGVGGMAVVYKAYDNMDNRIVAIKILKNEYIENAEFRRRFKNESKAIAVLSHQNIVKVFDVSYGDLIQYIVMEYVDGITLKEYIEQQGAIDPREAIYFITQILRALQHAHDKGIVHRDIKPQNIMLISDGTIKVTDFGIARMSRSETKTMTGEAIGSVHYISPEQVKGNLTDARTDIYSVGIVLYEMLTGKLPFESDNTAQVILMQIQKDPVLPHEINPNIAIGLEQIILRAMQKKQNDRYQSASEMLMDIEKFKQNPNIKFDYSYFVDKQPTKFIDKPEDLPIVTKPQPIEPIEDEKAQEAEEVKSKKTISVLLAALAGLVVCAVALVLIFLPSGSKTSVPDLVGLNFAEDVLNNDEYDMFKYQIVDDEDSDADEGIIVSQDPTGGKLEEGSTIILYVATSNLIEVPDVYGYEFASAETVLKGSNFGVKIEKEESDTVASGTVIRTEPAKNEMAQPGSTVTVYVSTSDAPKKVDVPSLMGLTISEAKKELEDAGLKLDTARTEYRSSDEKKGTIIGYEHLGEQVDEGTAIAVYVSTGKVVEETTTEKETTTKETTTEKEETTTKKETTTKETEPPETTTKKPKETTTAAETTKAEETTKKNVTTNPTQTPEDDNESPVMDED